MLKKGNNYPCIPFWSHFQQWANLIVTLQHKYVLATGRLMYEIKQSVCLLLSHHSFKCDLCNFEVQSRPEGFPWWVVMRYLILWRAAVGKVGKVMYSGRKFAVWMVLDFNVIEFISELIAIINIRSIRVNWLMSMQQRPLHVWCR